MKKNSLLKLLSIYTLILFLLQCLAMFGRSLFMGNIGLISADIPSSILTSHVILLGWLWFLVAQVLCYAVFVGLIVWLTSVLQRAFPWFNKGRLGVSLWLFAVCSVYVANQAYFPHSVFAFFSSRFSWNIILYDALIVWAFVLFFFVIACFKVYGWHKATIGVVCVAVLVGLPLLPKKPKSVSSTDKPNIIVIGLDAVRPDYLTYLPHVEGFMNQSTYFENTITPIARTFPAWSSILTGKNPKQAGARYGLPKFSELKLDNDLPRLLEKQGYYTIYGIDERLFNNIDVDHFGFNQFIGPLMGFNDFLLSTINDFPLTNLLINTRAGAWLFPYSHANRNAYVTYQPETYIRKVQRQLPNRSPLFLAIHLCLPHWNWMWAEAPFVDESDDVKKTQQEYRSSLMAADEQFDQLMKMLEKKGLLENAIVVVLSDHGQGFEEPADLLISKKSYQGNTLSHPLMGELTTPQVGHGTSLLSSAQYQSILGFRRYGGEAYVERVVTQRVSLLDIMPTLLGLLQLDDQSKYLAGTSLQCYLSKQDCKSKDRQFIMETGFTLPGILTSGRSLESVLGEGLSYFDLNPKTGRVFIKPELGKLIIQGKQRAVLQGPWMLVYYPLHKHAPLWLLVNVDTGQWTNELSGSLAKKAPVTEMQQQLKTFYGNEIE